MATTANDVEGGYEPLRRAAAAQLCSHISMATVSFGGRRAASSAPTVFARAAHLYRDGLSLAAIGHRFRVNASTIG